VRARYLTVLIILGAYFVASYFVLHAAFETQRTMLRVVFISGQQRMYSQRIAMFADAVVARKDPRARAQARRDLESSLDTFTAAHHALVTGDPSINPPGWPPASVRAMYENNPGVNVQVRDYIAHARAFDEHGSRARIGDPDLEYVLTVGPGPLLESLDAIVKQYNLETRRAIQKFEVLQAMILALGLATLAAVYFFILAPMERAIRTRTAELAYAASTDSLTQLLNRGAFTTRVADAMAAATRHGRSGAILMIDVDRFKRVNDTLGHAAGDRVQRELGARLAGNVRAGEFAGRLGGDEFAVFAPDAADDLEAFVTRMHDALTFTLDIDGTPVPISTSIGVARFPEDGGTLDALLSNADRALYDVKKTCRGSVQYFRPASTPA
jgi:diguanylate cyclase (GGDEF)-like protein